MLAVRLSVRSFFPYWTIKVRDRIAAKMVEILWNEGVRIVWMGGYKDNASYNGLGVKVGIPVPERSSIYVEIGSGG